MEPVSAWVDGKQVWRELPLEDVIEFYTSYTDGVGKYACDYLRDLVARREGEEKARNAREGFEEALEVLMNGRCETLLAEAPDEAPVTKMLCEVAWVLARWSGEWLDAAIATKREAQKVACDEAEALAAGGDKQA